jgi:cobalt/nickel transport system permease protein
LGTSRLSLFVGGFVAAWASIEVTALSVALQLAISGTSPANLVVPTMGAVHALIGIGEGLITVGALAFLYATRRDMVETGTKPVPAGRLVWVVGLLLALGLAGAAPWASSNPDGLEWVAQQQGFLSSAQGSGYQLASGYLMPGISNQTLATILAGILGTLIVFGAAVGIAFARRRRSQ